MVSAVARISPSPMNSFATRWFRAAKPSPQCAALTTSAQSQRLRHLEMWQLQPAAVRWNHHFAHNKIWRVLVLCLQKQGYELVCVSMCMSQYDQYDQYESVWEWRKVNSTEIPFWEPEDITAVVFHRHQSIRQMRTEKLSRNPDRPLMNYWKKEPSKMPCWKQELSILIYTYMS